MAEFPHILIDIKEEIMISRKGGKPISKTAHFIKPMLQFRDKTPILPTIHLPFRPALLQCSFNGWRGGEDEQWVCWVDKLTPKFKSLWKKAGILDSILSSKYKLIKVDELILGLVERWCCDTNTFVFPWGEATITLEDVNVLGGFSVLGSSVNEVNDDDDRGCEIEGQLSRIYDNLCRGVSQDVCQGLWMKRFMRTGVGVGVEFEHEAFLSFWLSRFVFPCYPFDSIVRSCFRIAVRLARGIRIALAPLVLASMYKDLSLMKSSMNAVNEVGENVDDLLVVTVWAPLQLVQVWAWERIAEFRPKPNTIGVGMPRVARWDGVNIDEIGNVRHILQSCGDSFEWRPYCKAVDSLPVSRLFGEQERLVFMGENVGEEVKVMAHCLRVGELAGLESIEQYNPHRVAMQFGLDQDVPCSLKKSFMGMRYQERQQLAWLAYTNPIEGVLLYIPPRWYEPLVTLRYLSWLREGVLTQRAALRGIVKRKRGLIRSRRSQAPRLLFDVEEDNSSPEINVRPDYELSLSGGGLDVHSGWDGTMNSDVPPGFTPISSVTKEKADELHHGSGSKKKTVCVEPDAHSVSEPSHSNGFKRSDVAPGFTPLSNVAKRKADELHGFDSNKKIVRAIDRLPGYPAFVSERIVTDLDVPPGFSPKATVTKRKVDVMPPGFVPNLAGNESDVPPGFKPISVTSKKVDNTTKERSFLKPLVEVKKECMESIGNGHHAVHNAHVAGNGHQSAHNAHVAGNVTSGHKKILDAEAEISRLKKMIAELKKGFN